MTKRTDAILEARISADSKPGEWRKLAAAFTDNAFAAQLETAVGGWYRLEVRVVADGQTVGQVAVEHVGVGEVFVVAGQSNSANHGSEKQTTKTGRVASFDGKVWRLSNDPQPGASGGKKLPPPPLGDALAQRFNVPIGFAACGIGATSVREWLPKGARFPNPPTIESRVQRLPGGEWESKGQAFDLFTTRTKALGLRGFRAVLWHQGESDANQRDTSRTLAGKLYREYLEQLIQESRKVIGWKAPWFVAQVSYHVPGDEASPDIRAAQASIVLTHSPQDYMEDHMNTCRLAVTAAFTHGMPNFQSSPPRPTYAHDVTVYHAMPHGLCDPLRRQIVPGAFVNTAAVHATKLAALAAHQSQQGWLDVSQGMNSYLRSMEEMSRAVGKLSKKFALAEGWRRHLHLGFSAQEIDPLADALGKDYRVNAAYERSLKAGAS
ncbi:MAG: hypothetical protein EB034_06080 [Verrucomicrobia bacterium]|nr:hypothetical protein [Verrucomicrobiota bacterium]